jgi:hypothetical protein
LLATGTLNAAICENTITYNGTVAQTIKPTTYCHIILNSSGIKTASGSFDTNGDLTISFGSNLIISNGVTIQVRGAATTAGSLTNGGNLLVSD